MKAKKFTLTSDEPVLRAVILSDGALVVATSIPRELDNKFPCHVIRDKTSLTTGNLEYWAKQSDTTPIFEGDKVILEF